MITLLVVGRLIGDQGVAYVMAAVEVCALLWSAVGGNLSDTLGRLLRSRRNKGQYKNMAQLRKSAMIFHLALGLLGSLLLFCFGGMFVEGVFGLPYSTLIVQVLSPVVALRSVSAVLLGWFQGEGVELPTMISGLLRQGFLLGFGFMFVKILGGYGEKVSALLQQNNYTAMYGGVGFAIAVSVTEVLIVLFLVLIYRGMHKTQKEDFEEQDGMNSVASTLDCIKALCISRWPMCVMTFLEIFPLAIGLFFAGRVMGEGGLFAEYGVYVGKYLAICGIAVSLITITILPLIARVVSGFRREELKFARMAFQSGVHSCIVHGIFFTVFVAVMETQLVEFFCVEDQAEALAMLLGGSSLIVFAALSFYFGKLLQMGGKKFFVLGALGGADVLFLLIVLIASGVGKAGVLALVYGGLFCMAGLCILLGMLTYRQMRVRMNWLQVLIIPLGSGSVAGLICALLARVIAPHLDSLVTLLVSCVVVGVIYWILLLLLKNFKEQELDVTVGGRLISMLGQLLRVY